MNANLSAAPLYALPDSVHELIALIGVPAALALVERYGGIRLFVPVRERLLSEDHPLMRVVGHDAARALVREYPGIELTIPRCVAAMRALRDREIRRLHRAEGWTAARIAQWAALTERQVYTILAAADDPPDDRQAALF